MTYDAGDEKHVKKRKSKRQLEEERCQEELRVLLQNDGARYFLWRLLSECRAYHTISGHDAHNMAIRSGMRDIGLWTLGEILEADPLAYDLMQSEGRTRDSKQGIKNG